MLVPRRTILAIRSFIERFAVTAIALARRGRWVVVLVVGGGAEVVGRAVTTGLSGLWAEATPPLLVAVTLSWIREPTSAVVST